MAIATKKNLEKKEKISYDFQGSFVNTIGRRKTAVAQVRFYKTGTGFIAVNNMKAEQYFTAAAITVLTQALKLSGHVKDFDFSLMVNGGGKKSQAEAAKLGIARALILFDKDLRPALKAKDLLTRDARKKERKKPGLKKARKAPQWAKR